MLPGNLQNLLKKSKQHKLTAVRSNFPVKMILIEQSDKPTLERPSGELIG